MDTSNIRIATSNLADSMVNTIQNFESQTITDTMSRHSQVLQVISKLYSDILDLVL
jgi:hypothetical protein